MKTHYKLLTKLFPEWNISFVSGSQIKFSNKENPSVTSNYSPESLALMLKEKVLQEKGIEILSYTNKVGGVARIDNMAFQGLDEASAIMSAVKWVYRLV